MENRCSGDAPVMGREGVLKIVASSLGKWFLMPGVGKELQFEEPSHWNLL